MFCNPLRSLDTSTHPYSIIIRLISIVCSHSTSSTLPFYLSSTPSLLPHPMTPSIFHFNLEEIVERNIKASRVCDPTIVDDCLTPTSNVESNPGEGHLGRCPDLQRRDWRMCWFEIEDQTCSTRNRIASTCFFVLFHTLVLKAIDWIESITPRSSFICVTWLHI